MTRGCATCHAIEGTAALARKAPDLTHLASRQTLAAASVPNTVGHLAGWILDPQSIKPGAKMPATTWRSRASCRCACRERWASRPSPGRCMRWQSAPGTCRRPFVAATANEALHFAQHASFLASALLFWWMVFARRDVGALMALFGTMLYTGALGALMTFSKTAWYAGYALADQTLAGLVMWIPAGLAYPAAALYLATRWLARSQA